MGIGVRVKTLLEAASRVYQLFDASGDVVDVDGVPRAIYHKIIGMNARGQVTVEQLGDNLPTATPAAVLFLQPGHQRLEIINNGGCIHFSRAR